MERETFDIKIEELKKRVSIVFLLCYGADGFLCTPISDEIDTRIRAEAWLDGTSEGDTVHFSVMDAEGIVVAQSEIAASKYVCVDLHIPRLISGRASMIHTSIRRPPHW